MGKVTREDHITILNLHDKGKSVRHIANEVGHSPATIQKYGKMQPEINVFKKYRESRLDPYKEEIEAILDLDIGKQSHNVKTALREMRLRHPELNIKKSAFYQFVKDKCDLTRESKLARIPLEHLAGVAQIDFCKLIYYRRGKRIDGHQFTMSFPKSDVSFVQLFPAENQQCLFEAMVNIFEFIGFVPSVVIFDNASTAVLMTKGKGVDAVPTHEYENFSAYYGFECRFCNPSSGWEKGSVERNNGILRKDYFVPPPQIEDEQAFNRILLERCMNDAQALHYLKGVAKTGLFETDREAGHPLPLKRFDCRKTVIRMTDKCALIQLDKCRYSVSDKHPRRQVVVKYGAFVVDIYDLTGELICSHRRSYKPGSTTIDKSKYSNALAARPRACIKESDNEYTEGILTEFKEAVCSVRPAAQEEALVDFCGQHGITCLPLPSRLESTMLLYDLLPFEADKDQYDQNIQSNGDMVQAAEIRRAVCRSRQRPKK